MHQKIEHISIIGAGFMGTEIASRAVLHGYSVSVFDVDPAALEKSRETIEAFIQAKIEFQEISEDASAVNERIRFFKKMEHAVEVSDLVIEAAVEKLDIKRELFSKLDALLPPSVILASNSSSIPISRIETGVNQKERILNMHFSAPIENLYYVELMRGSETGDETIMRASEWLVSIGCLPLLCKKESVGFIFNRVWHAARREAMKVWEEGVADIQEIDKAWMLFSGMPFGPFGLMDLIGLDIVYAVQNLYYEDSKDPYFKPPQALKEMVDRGDLGVKTGRGFYTWPEAECVQPDFLETRVPDKR
jgi:3-hydroxybutyryl-CoA dehydrogenase